MKVVRKRLSARAHAAILRRVAERDQHLLLAEALNQSIERVVEQDLGISLDRANWSLNMEDGVLEREARHDANPAA